MVDMQKGDFPKCMVGFSFEHMDDLPSPDTVKQELALCYHKYAEQETQEKEQLPAWQPARVT